MNHVCYVDDLYWIRLSSANMQRLLHTDYAEQHSLPHVYTGGREGKSFTVCFKSKTIIFERPGLILGKLEIPLVRECEYLRITNNLIMRKTVTKIYIDI